MRARLAPYALLAVLVAVFLGDTLTGARIFALRDVIFDAVPWRRFAAAAFAEWHVPLWNPYSRFGQPFVANPQSAVFYPPHLLFSLLPAAPAVSLNIAFHLAVAACGMFALGRRLGLGVAGAIVAAVTYAFGSYMTVNLEFMSVMETLAWAPLTVLAAHRLLDADVARSRRLRHAAALAVLLALQVLPGNPQPFLYTLVVAAALMVSRAVGEGRTRSLAPAALTAVAAGALAVGLCAVQLLPTWELVPLSIRADGVDPGLGIASMHPRHLLSAVLPFVDGRPGAANWHGAVFEFWLGAFYVGIPALLLAIAAFLPFGTRRAPRYVTRWAAGLLVVGFVLAMGRFTFVYPLLLDVVPGFDHLRWPAKALQLVATALAVLAGVGADRLLSLPRLRSRAVAGVVVALVFANLWFHARQIHATLPGDILDRRPAALDAFPGHPPERAWIEPAQTWGAYAVYGSRDEADYRAALDALAGETALPYGLHKTWGGDALHVRTAERLTDVLDKPGAPADQVARIARRASIRWAWHGDPPRWDERSGAYPRAYVAAPWKEQDEVWPTRALPPPQVDGDTVRVHGPLPAGRLVVLTDTAYPGWTAHADGVPLRIYTVDDAFRAVKIPGPAPADELVFTYEPASFSRGRRISLLGVGLLLGLLLGPLMHSARRRRAERDTVAEPLRTRIVASREDSRE